MNLSELLIVEDGVLKGYKSNEKTHNITEMKLPNQIHVIGNYAFFNDNSVESIIFSDSVEVISKHAICQCYKLKKIYIPKSVKIIEEEAIHRCSKDLVIYLEGKPQEGWIDKIEKKIVEDRIITDEDNAFNFHRSSGGWSYTTVRYEVSERHYWNAEKYTVYDNVPLEEFFKK